MREIVAKDDNIPLGRQGENLCTRVTLPNIRDGAGTIALYHQRSGDAAPYPLEITEDGDSIYWDISSVDTAVSGFGRAEMQWLGERGEILKSRIYRTYVEKALTSPGRTPDPLEDYAVKIAKSAAAAKASEDAASRYSDTAYQGGIAATESAERAAGSASAAADSAASASDAAKDAAAALKALEDGIAAGDFKGDKGDKGADGKDAPQIDDTAISAANPWSSKHIVDMLCSPLEESGNPVVCYPVAGYPLGVKASWEPMQEGNGDPSPDNIRPIKGRESVTITRQEDNQVITLALPETVYGGAVDAVSSEVAETWGVVTLDGEEGWKVLGKFLNNKTDWYYTSPKIPNAVNASPQKGNEICSHYPHADVANNNTVKGCAIVWGSIRIRWGDTIPDDTDAWKAYLAAQYAAGTPVQIAYKLAAPVPFTATGAQPIPALAGANTVLTDADSATVTGRADPIKRITDLEDAVASQT